MGAMHRSGRVFDPVSAMPKTTGKLEMWVLGTNLKFVKTVCDVGCSDSLVATTCGLLLEGNVWSHESTELLKVKARAVINNLERIFQ